MNEPQEPTNEQLGIEICMGPGDVAFLMTFLDHFYPATPYLLAAHVLDESDPKNSHVRMSVITNMNVDQQLQLANKIKEQLKKYA